MKRIAIILSVSLYMLAGIRLLAGNAVIIGNISNGGAGVVVRLLAPAGPFTDAHKLVATDTADQSGNFRFNISLDNPVQIAVDVWFYSDYFFLFPGDTLRIKTDQPLPGGLTPGEGSAGFYETSPEPASARSQIREFDKATSNLLDTTFTEIFRKRDLAMARKVIARMTQLSQQATDPFASAYMHYQILGMSEEMMLKTPGEVISELIPERPDYQNPACLQLISAFFSNYHIKSLPITESQALPLAVKGIYHPFLDALGNDSLLRNEIVRELAAIQIITDITLSLPLNERMKPIGMLDSLALTTKFPEHRKLALDQSRQLKELLPGTPAPLLPGTGTKTYDTLAGKPLLIIFTHTGCATCNEAAEWLSGIKKAENWPLNVLTLFFDQSEDDYDNFAPRSRWPWKSIWCGKDVNLAWRWKIRSLPLTALVDSEGNIIQFPGPLPGPETEKMLKKLAEVSRPARRQFRPGKP